MSGQLVDNYESLAGKRKGFYKIPIIINNSE